MAAFTNFKQSSRSCIKGLRPGAFFGSCGKGFGLCLLLTKPQSLPGTQMPPGCCRQASGATPFSEEAPRPVANFGPSMRKSSSHLLVMTVRANSIGCYFLVILVLLLLPRHLMPRITDVGSIQQADFRAWATCFSCRKGHFLTNLSWSVNHNCYSQVPPLQLRPPLSLGNRTRS